MIFNGDIQLVYKLLVIFLYSFCAAWWSAKYLFAKLHERGYYTHDKYKKGVPKVLDMGGISIVIGVLVSLALSQILLNQEGLGRLFIFYFVVLAYALYGLMDDIFKFKQRYDKIIILLVLTIPIASLISDTQINALGFSIELGVIYSLLLAPIYIMVIGNMINLHAGYNGLTQGLSLILLITLGIQSYIMHGFEYLVFLMPILGAVAAFMFYTFPPAKALPGNVGDLMVGGALGAFIIANQMLWFGIFIFIPHIINFLMDTWTLVIRRIPDQKFGKLRSDGTIQAPPSMKYKSLKFLVVSWWRLTERQAVLVLYGITTVFCVVGLLIF